MAQLTRIHTFGLALAIATTLIAAPGTHAQTAGDPEEFTAFAVAMGAYSSGTANLIITVNRWATQAEQERMFTLLREKGQRAFFEAVRDAKRAGSIRTAETVGYEIRFAIEEPAPDGGRRVLIATDRPIAFAEATNRPVSIDYPLTVIELNLDANGKGEGTMSFAAKVIPAGKNIVIENFDTQPIRLNRVESRKLTKR